MTPGQRCAGRAVAKAAGDRSRAATTLRGAAPLPCRLVQSVSRRSFQFLIVGLAGLLAVVALSIANPSSASVPERACIGHHCPDESAPAASADNDAFPAPLRCLHREACGGGALLAGSALALAVILGTSHAAAVLPRRLRRARPRRLRLRAGITDALFRPPRLAA